jgi:NAD(P)-dependent dehydrogenase (short-subunit alcohol dehydrogenase family)
MNSMPAGKTFTHEGRVAAVTGAGRGIGQAICRGLAERGATVVAVDVGDLGETERIVRAAQHDCLGIHADVASPEDTRRVAKEVQERFGHCDILVNNAGIFPLQSWDQVDYDAWRKVLTVNLDSQFLMCQALVPLMKRGGWGRIVNITSDSLFGTGAGMTAYKASKAGVIGFTRGLAADVGEYGITVNAVGPALTRTPGVLESGHAALLQGSAQRRIIKRIPEPDDVVGTVLFLTSNDSYFVTGQTIMANGGGSFV